MSEKKVNFRLQTKKQTAPKLLGFDNFKCQTCNEIWIIKNAWLETINY